MAEDEKPDDTNENAAPKKASKLPLIIGLVLALVSGGGGFYAVQSGLLFGGESHAEDGHGDGGKAAGHEVADMPDVTFVPIEPLVISLADRGAHLRFRAQLEVRSAYSDEVTKLMPRVVDVLNNYLRALETEDLADGPSLARLRAQMLRRIQIVTGGGRVNDLLIMEFVLN